MQRHQEERSRGHVSLHELPHREGPVGHLLLVAHLEPRADLRLAEEAPDQIEARHLSAVPKLMLVM